jgi:hypothetical protein
MKFVRGKKDCGLKEKDRHRPTWIDFEKKDTKFIANVAAASRTFGAARTSVKNAHLPQIKNGTCTSGNISRLKTSNWSQEGSSASISMMMERAEEVLVQRSA